MLAKLVTRHLRAYRLHVAVIIVMQVCAQIAALSLPTINADIINKGVVTADTGYVTTHSLLHAGDRFRADHLPGHCGLSRRSGGDGNGP